MIPAAATMGFVRNVMSWYFDATWSLIVLMSKPAPRVAVNHSHRTHTDWGTLAP